MGRAQPTESRYVYLYGGHFYTYEYYTSYG